MKTSSTRAERAPGGTAASAVRSTSAVRPPRSAAVTGPSTDSATGVPLPSRNSTDSLAPSSCVAYPPSHPDTAYRTRPASTAARPTVPATGSATSWTSAVRGLFPPEKNRLPRCAGAGPGSAGVG